MVKLDIQWVKEPINKPSINIFAGEGGIIG